MHTLKLMSLILIFILLQQIVTKCQLTLTCTACKIPCKFQNCVQANGNGFSKQFCPSYAPCSPFSIQTIQLNKCKYNMIGTICSQSICIYYETQTTCMNDITDCVEPFSYLYQCQDCVSNPCQKCLRTTDTSIDSYYQQCIGTICDTIGKTKLDIGLCPGNQDNYGNACTCCGTLTTTSDGGISQCIEQAGGIFQDSDLRNWVLFNTTYYFNSNYHNNNNNNNNTDTDNNTDTNNNTDTDTDNTNFTNYTNNINKTNNTQLKVKLYFPILQLKIILFVVLAILF